MEFRHSKNIQIRFGDVDLMGHVNNAVQLSYFDLARMDYFEGIYNQTIDWQEAALIVAHLEIDYLAPILLKDKVEVRTKITRIGTKSVGLRQQIVDRITGQVKTESTQVMVGFSPKRGESIVVPDVLKIRIQEFEGEVLV
ncbi:MAG: acyl-CoA thioesterase [Marinifilaceae bacterium]